MFNWMHIQFIFLYLCRLWSCDPFKQNWQGFLHAICPGGHPTNPSPPLRPGGASPGAHIVDTRLVKRSPWASIPTVQHPVTPPGARSGRARVLVPGGSCGCVRRYRTWLGLPGLALLLLHLAHHHRIGWLHSGRLSRPAVPATVQSGYYLWV